MRFYCECQHEWNENSTPETCPHCGSSRFAAVPNLYVSLFLVPIAVALFMVLGGALVAGFTEVKIYLVAGVLGLVPSLFRGCRSVFRYFHVVSISNRNAREKRKKMETEGEMETVPDENRKKHFSPGPILTAIVLFLYFLGVLYAFIMASAFAYHAAVPIMQAISADFTTVTTHISITL